MTNIPVYYYTRQYHECSYGFTNIDQHLQDHLEMPFYFAIQYDVGGKIMGPNPTFCSRLHLTDLSKSECNLKDFRDTPDK